jgi:hypothetical protein
MANNRHSRRPEQYSIVGIFFTYGRSPVWTHLVIVLTPSRRQSENVCLFFRVIVKSKVNQFCLAFCRTLIGFFARASDET